MGLNNSTTQGQ